MATELEMALQAGGKIKRPDLPLDFAPETDISGVASQMVTTPSVEPSFGDVRAAITIPIEE